MGPRFRIVSSSRESRVIVLCFFRKTRIAIHIEHFSCRAKGSIHRKPFQDYSILYDFIRDDGALLLEILLVLFDQAIHALEVLLKNIDLKVLEELIVPL